MPIYQSKSKWDTYNFLLIYAILIPVLIIMMLLTKAPWRDQLIVIPSLLGVMTLLFLTIYITINYKIDNEYVRYRLLFIFYGKIKIEKIHKIDVGKTLYVGMRPAFARNGLIIHYNKYEEIYISPKNNEEFVQELLKRNPNIEIIRWKSKK